MEDVNPGSAFMSRGLYDNDYLPLDGNVHYLNQGNLVILLFEYSQGRCNYFEGLF